jgi:RNA polymerase sigma-70 factor (ECF subfamily)
MALMPPHPPTSSFVPTRWTMVLAAASPTTDPLSQRALAELAQAYWFPLYAYARRRGLSAPDAEDLIQSFFSTLLEKKFLTAVDPAKGRFRSFLLAALQHFLSNEFDKANAHKRGGSLHILPLETGTAESRYLHEPATDLTPEKLFERRWALALLDRVLLHLESQYAARNEAALFSALKPLLTAAPLDSYADIAASFHMNEGAVKTAAHRLRRRYRDLLREEIAHTVASPAEIEDEITHLLNSL